MMNKYLKIARYITNTMKKKKFIINISEKKTQDETDNYKYFEVCEICRNKYLGKYDSYGNCITWKKISEGNCYCQNYEEILRT